MDEPDIWGLMGWLEEFQKNGGETMHINLTRKEVDEILNSWDTHLINH